MSEEQSGQVTAVDSAGGTLDAPDEEPTGAAVADLTAEEVPGQTAAAAPAGDPLTPAGSPDTVEGSAVSSPDETVSDPEPERADQASETAEPDPELAATPTAGTAQAETAQAETAQAETAQAETAQAETPEELDGERLRSAAEAILFVVDRPTTTVELAQVLDVPQPAAEAALVALRAELDEQRRGFDLREVAGGWRLYTREEFAPYVERYVLDGQQARLTQAALETLAVVAYRQPVTRSRISAIRGVSVDGVIRTLLSRGLIEECGSEPDTGGLLYRTTPLFLEKLGLQSVDDLPSLAPLLPELEAVEDVAPSS